MALPRQIQRQAEEVAQLEAQIVAQNQPAEGTDVAPQADPPSEPQPTPPAEVQSNTPPAVTTPPAPAPRHDDFWEQKFRTLQGMFNSQVPTLQTQVRELTEKLDKALHKLAEKDQAQPNDITLVTPKDTEAFGADLVDLARRVAREEVERREAKQRDDRTKFEGEVRQYVGAVEESQKKTAEDLFFDRLATVQPNWERLQATSECQQWLGTRPLGSEATWNDILKGAAARLNVQRVVEVFQAFTQSYPQYAPRAAEPEPASPEPKKPSAELARQVAPRKSSASAASTPSEKITYSGGDFERESMTVIRLRKAGRHDDAARLENELNAALTEGRIRP